MAQILQIKSPVFAVVTSDSQRYLAARKEVEELTQEHDLTVADMPMAIQAMTNNSEVRGAVRPKWIDTITGEYHGQRNGDRSYETWHSVGSLATLKGLSKAFKNVGNYGFMEIEPNEWASIGDGRYVGQDVARVHIEDLRKGKNLPVTGTPYTTFILLDKDKPTISGSSQLDYDTFMKDDRVLMVAGSPDNREALAKMLFGAKEDGGEGYSSIGNYHRMNDVSFDASRGRLVYLNNYNNGLNGDNNISISGRFLGVSDGVASIGDATQKILEPKKQVVGATLEQTLSIINNPDMNRVDMVGAVHTLYEA